MRKSEIEATVLAAIDRAQRGGQDEDRRIEFKSEWPEPKKAARQIAAHVNQARSDEALWIIGVDARGNVTQPARNELATWWPQVESEFDQLAPSVLDGLIVHVGDESVFALVLDGSRAPYVVKADGGRLEILWRELTRVRWARRDEIMRMVGPAAKAPAIEVLSATGEDVKVMGAFAATLLVVPRTTETLTFVHHRTRIDYAGVADFQTTVEFATFGNREPWVHNVPAGVMMERGGSLMVKARWVSEARDEQNLTLRLALADPNEPPIAVPVTLIRQGSGWMKKPEERD